MNFIPAAVLIILLMRGEGKNVKLLVCLWQCKIRRLVGSRRAQWLTAAVINKPGTLYFTHQNQSGTLQKGYRKTFQSFHTCTVYDYDIMKNGKFHTILKSKFVLIKLYLSPSRPSQYRSFDDQIPCLNRIMKWCNKIRIKMASLVTTLFPQLAVLNRVLQFSNWLYWDNPPAKAS